MTTVEITSIAGGGDGVGRSDGVVIFTPRTAPGDIANVRVQMQKRFARASLESLEQESAQRVDAPCPHYTADKCGGCQLQHIGYDFQLAAKSQIIRDSLQRIGKRSIDALDVLPSPSEWRYRRKLTLHVRRRGGEWIAGLHPYDNPDAVFDLHDCPITAEPVLAIWKELRPMLRDLPRDDELRVAVRLVEHGAAVVVEGGTNWPQAKGFFERMPSILELWWRPRGGAMRRLNNRDPHSVSGASFVQINAGVAEQLHSHVIERVRSFSPKTILDAYAGSGATAIPLSRDTVVTAIELDARAVAVMQTSIGRSSRVVAGRVEDHVASSLPADVILLNPPRTGLDPHVAFVLQATLTPPRAIIYTSCDPATLARDLARMPRYRIASLRAFDMFPQTAHVETVCELVPEAA